MDKIERIKIEGFRRLNNVDLEMRPLMVMIGANGIGKTSFLDVLSIISASANKRLNKIINSEYGGIGDLITRGREDDLKLSLWKKEPAPFEPYEYSIHLRPKGQSYQIDFECMSQVRNDPNKPMKHLVTSSAGNIKYFDTKITKLVKPDWEIDDLESSLSQVPQMFQEPESFRRLLSSFERYHVLDVGPRAPVKLPQQMRPADFPGEDGEDLVSFLYGLRESDFDRYEMIEDTLKAAFPGFESLNFPIVAAGMVAMTWKEEAFSKPLYMHQLSEGTLRFLWLTSLLACEKLPMVTMIDEPEVSMHPELLNLLADLMRETSQRTQLVVATHSDRLIRFLKPEEVLVMDRDDNGFTTARWADSLNLDEWLADYTLDELWRRGLTGGRA